MGRMKGERIPNETDEVTIAERLEFAKLVLEGLRCKYCCDQCYYKKRYGCSKEKQDSIMIGMVRRIKLGKLLDKGIMGI